MVNSLYTWNARVRYCSSFRETGRIHHESISRRFILVSKSEITELCCLMLKLGVLTYKNGCQVTSVVGFDED